METKLVLMKRKLALLDYWFDKNFGWFFTNGRKQEDTCKRIREKREKLRKNR